MENNRPMLSMRVYCPAHLAAAAQHVLRTEPAVTGVAVMTGASVEPSGDLIVATLPRTVADHVIEQLVHIGVAQEGMIETGPIDGWVSQRALAEARTNAPDDVDAVVWTDVVEDAYDRSALTWGFLAFMSMATMIAAIAIVLDSQVLVIGAMVLGPEFGAVAAMGIALVTRRYHLLGSAVRTLVVGFVVAIALTTALSALAVSLGWITATAADGDRPLTAFIYRPDGWSVAVAIIAGVAGVLALATDRSASLTGVFISVTTIPAAGNIAVAIPLGQWNEVAGSSLQLAINITGMAIAGWATLAVLRRFRWRPRAAEPLQRQG